MTHKSKFQVLGITLSNMENNNHKKNSTLLRTVHIVKELLLVVFAYRNIIVIR